MNYYPNNFYSGYQYQNPYLQPQSTVPTNPIPAQTMQNGLNGKIVDNQEMVKIMEVPFGSYGVYPTADLKEIYVKTWNNNGTTKIATYKPVVTDDEVDIELNPNEDIIQKISNLEAKIDNLVEQYKSMKEVSVAPKAASTATIIEKRKGVEF